MLTLFLYLNDVEEGGGTHFPLLDITIQPKKGNAVIWPSVLDDKPETKDPRTDHEALPVINGIKYVSTSVWRWRSRCSMHNSCHCCIIGSECLATHSRLQSRGREWLCINGDERFELMFLFARGHR